MNRKLLYTFLLIIVSAISQAHEFWMHPDKFFYTVGDDIIINFEVGENFIGEPWNLRKDRLSRLELHQLAKQSDLKQQVVKGLQANLKIKASAAGTHLIVMQSTDAFIKLDGEKFNSYLQEDGLDEIYYQREKTNTLSDSAKELYSRHTKLLIQVGGEPDDTFKKIAGLPVEIVPEKNPYTLKVGDPVRFKILYDSKPFFGAKVKVWNRYKNRTTVQNIFAQQDGMIETRISNPGAWMVSVVKMVPSKDTKANWQSYWGSLVFGIK